MKKFFNIVLHVMLFVFLIVAGALVYWYASQNNIHGNRVELNEGWTIKVNEDIYDNVDLNDFHMPVSKRGDWLVLTSVLPDNLFDNGTLCLYTRDSVTDVYVDGELIYEYGVEEFNEDLHIGFGNRLITLPSDCAGKPLKITFLVTENNAFSTITAPLVYDESSVMRDYLKGKMIYLGVAVALIAVGFCISIITFCLYFKSYSMEKLFCIGVFAVCIGFWALCNQDLDYILTSSLRVKTFLQFISFYLMLFPLLLYFREDVDKRSNKFECFFYYTFLFIEIQMFAIAVILQITNVLHFPVFESIYYVFIGVVSIFILVVIIRSIKSEKTHLILVAGFAIEFLAALRDLGVYIAIRYFKVGGSEGRFIACFPIASLILVASMLVDFIYEMRKVMYAAAETEFLIKIAYVDVLTELNTRRKIEEYFAQISKRKQEYLIVQFDLNNLKTTNDTYGHELGDELIIRFTNMLKEIFNEGEILGRMGGDEFIAIVRDSYDYDVEAKLRRLDAAIVEDNEHHEPVKVSVSYGYASSNEFEEPEIGEVYRAADKRMYLCKEAYYRSTGHGRRRYDDAQ